MTGIIDRMFLSALLVAIFSCVIGVFYASNQLIVKFIKYTLVTCAIYILILSLISIWS